MHTMRIIGGFHRGRKIEAPEGETTRPMTDRVRENLFNLLREEVAGAVVLDVFSGSGALGIEALSRGAASCTFVDDDDDAIACIRANVERLGLAGQTRILRRSALKPGPWIKPHGADAYTILLIDPPYRMTESEGGQRQLAEMIAGLVDQGLVALGAVAMIRAERGIAMPLPWLGFAVFDERSYGTTTLHLMIKQ
jgi:16S rRNA (guanine966-N2)-methyltransferase